MEVTREQYLNAMKIIDNNKKIVDAYPNQDTKQLRDIDKLFFENLICEDTNEMYVSVKFRFYEMFKINFLGDKFCIGKSNQWFKREKLGQRISMALRRKHLILTPKEINIRFDNWAKKEEHKLTK